MSRFSTELQARLVSVDVRLSSSLPRLLLGAGDVDSAREKVRSVPGLVDEISARAREAAKGDSLFRPKNLDSYLFPHLRDVLKPLCTAALLLEDERSAARALEAVETYFAMPTRQWAPPARRDMRCHHAIPNTASLVGVTMDMCAAYWPSGAAETVSERIGGDLMDRFLETWQKQDEHWADPDYHFNWKMMCCGESGLGALASGEYVKDLSGVLEAALAGCLDVLDNVPAEGDWAEGPSYWLNTLAHGLRFGVALRRATGGEVDMLAHPALQVTGDFVMHVMDPDERFYNFNDNRLMPPDLSIWGYMSLLAKNARRGDWARVARLRGRETLEQILWDDPSLKSETPPENDTARHFPWTGLATLRSGWDEAATFVGFKSGPSDVGHSHLDANSFVVSVAGERLLIDEGTWPYAALLGFFELPKNRFNFDSNSTIGHNTLLVDGRGQRWGPEYPGKIVHFESNAEVDTVVGEAAAAYDGKLDRFTRTLAFIKPDVLLVLDQVSSGEPRYLEWLFHHSGEATGDEDETIFRRGDAELSLTRLLPREADCWRISDVVRTSAYTDSNTLEKERVSVRYRSFGPFHPCKEIEMLWAICVGKSEARPSFAASFNNSAIEVELDYPGGCSRKVSLSLERNSW